MKLFKENINYIYSNQRFKFILGVLICITLYEGATTKDLSYLGCILDAFTNPLYICVIVFLFLANTINTITIFEENRFYIIRCKTKKKYLSEMLKNVLVSNLIVFVIQIVMLIIGILIFNRNGIVIDKIGGYNITNLAYIIFYTIRFLILIQIFSIISTILIKSGRKYLTYVLNVIFFIMIQFNTYSDDIAVSKISEMFINPAKYFGIYNYATFNLEFICSLIYIVLISILTYLGYRISVKFIKQVGV